MAQILGGIGSEGSLNEKFRAFGEAILGTPRYVSMHFLFIFVSRLRRGDFRYTTIGL